MKKNILKENCPGCEFGYIYITNRGIISCPQCSYMGSINTPSNKKIKNKFYNLILKK